MEQSSVKSGPPFAAQRTQETETGAGETVDLIGLLARELGELPSPQQPGQQSQSLSLSKHVGESGTGEGDKVSPGGGGPPGAKLISLTRPVHAATAELTAETMAQSSGQGVAGVQPSCLMDQTTGAPLQSRQSSCSTSQQVVDEEVVDVDGVSKHTVDTWFWEVNSRSTGTLADRDAVAFFKRTGLSGSALSQIWNRVKAVSVSGQAGLNRAQFSMALRLVALAQSGQALTDELAWLAVNPHKWRAAGRDPLPAPQLAPSPRRSNEWAGRKSGEVARPQQVALRPDVDGAIDLARLQGQNGQELLATLTSQQPPLGQSDVYLEQVRDSPGEAPLLQPHVQKMTDAPICFEARLPPLHPKRCSNLTMLASGHGSLFSGPSSHGGLLQWGRPEGNMRRPTADSRGGGENSSDQKYAALNEDLDVAPSSETLLPEAKQVTCMHVDEVTNILWVGQSEGKVTAFALGPAPGSSINTRRIHHWQAHKLGRVTAICTTARGDVWTASSRGSIRVWHVESQAVGTLSVSLPRELRRPGGFRAAASAINFLVFPSCGQVVWSGSAKSLLIWDVYTGAYLGAVQRSYELDLDREHTRKFLEHSERDQRFAPRLPIDHRQGLDLDDHGKIVLKGFATRRKEFVAEQEAWAIQTDKKTSEWVENVGVLGGKAIDNAGKAAGKAGKFIGRMGGKLVRNIKGDGGGGGASELKFPREGSFTHRVRVGNADVYSEADNSGEEAVESEVVERGGKDGQLRALAADSANTVWAAWQSGKMERFTFNARLLVRKDMGCGISSLAAVGPRLWVGLVDGRIRVLADQMSPREWRAHESGVTSIVATGSRVYSLAADGSIRGWCSSIPSEHDQTARQALESAAPMLMEKSKLEILSVTWNVNEQKPSHSSFFGTVGQLARSDSVKVAVFGLQEIEMGGGSVAMAAAKDALHKKAQEKGNTNGQWWASQLLMNLGGSTRWRQCGLRQLSGMLIVVFARTELEGKIGEVSTASVACGVLGVGGNKGAVAVSFTLCRRRIACVCSHFAAHQGALEARYHNYLTITKNLTFSKLPWFDLQVYNDEEEHVHRHARRLMDNGSDSASDNETPSELAAADMIQGQGMRAAEMLIWVGDFNYRVNCSYEEAKECIRRGRLERLLEKDQCKAEMKAGRIFRYLREGTIRFPPTYKFNKNDPDPFGYDTSEKRRVPAWTDRIFFRGSHGQDSPEEEATASLIDGFDAEPEQPKVGRAEAITVEATEYAAGLEITDSDHKPVWARLLVSLPVTLQDKKRRKCSHLLKDCFLHTAPEPPRAAILNPVVNLHPIERRCGNLVVQNTGTSAAAVNVVPLVESWERPPTDAPREIPDWLDVFPVSFRIPPKSTVDVRVALSQAESTWAPKDKLAQLRLKVDHDFATGGTRPEGASQRDLVFTVCCSMQRQ